MRLNMVIFNIVFCYNFFFFFCIIWSYFYNYILYLILINIQNNLKLMFNFSICDINLKT